MKLDTKEIIIEVNSIILRGLAKQGVIIASEKDLLDLARLSEFAHLEIDIKKIRDDLRDLCKMDMQARREKVKEIELGC